MNMENNITAVEWLYNNLKPHFEHDGDLLEVVQMSFDQAKEMEKEQIIRAGADHCYPTKEIAIQYAIKFFSRV